MARTPKGGTAQSWLAAVFMAACALGVTVVPCHAVYPDEILADAALEKRARALSSELRCLVCQNQSIDDSDAPLAKDLRVLVRERLVKGDSDEAVRAYIVDRYGDFVLLKPPFNAMTLVLWIAPLLMLGGAVWLARRLFAAPRPSNADAPLSADEKAALERVLSRTDLNGSS